MQWAHKKNHKKKTLITKKVIPLIFFMVTINVVWAIKNYAVHQSLEDPGSASQQSECNDPAPH